VAKVITIENSIVVDSTPEQVFAYLTDLDRQHEWSPGDFRVENLSDPELKVGTTWTSYGFQPPNTHDHRNDATVTEYVPGERFAFDVIDGSDTHQYSYTLTAVDGGTQLDRVMEMPKPGGPQGIAVEGVAKMIIKPGMQKNLEKLKKHVEEG
jgi:uncharacterized protein YndB with AHSA1/START domain